MHTHDNDTESGRRGPTSTRNQPRAARGPDPRRIVDLEHSGSGEVMGLHNIAADLQGPPSWRLWATVAVLGTMTAIALMMA
ncbi:MAG: hypothetical protein U1F43_01495 [Myxococcota bacterium]